MKCELKQLLSAYCTDGLWSTWVVGTCCFAYDTHGRSCCLLTTDLYMANPRIKRPN